MSISHWSLRYLRDKLAYSIWCSRRPDAPWLTPAGVDFLTEWLRPEDVGIEWGSGRSTAWLAGRVGRLVSVEHDPTWHRTTSDQLTRRGLTNVTYLLVEAPDTTDAAPDPPYPAAAREAVREPVTFALVDGIFRDRCAAVAMELLSPGGLLVIDDAQRYLPHASRTPGAIGEGADGPGEVWPVIGRQLRAWRWYWTSNGIKDTAFFVKPHPAAQPASGT